MAQPLVEPETHAAFGEHATRLARLIRAQFGFVWRVLRRIGVTDTEADSAAQEVFSAVVRRIDDIRKDSERAFLFSTSLHVAARVQRERMEPAALSEGAPALEDLDEAQQAREILGVLLQQMPVELRVVFILHELEQLAAPEIAEILGIPLMTVAARLSESRDDLATHLEAGSDLADSLMIAAREEQPPEGALHRTLLAFGPSVSASLDMSEADTGAMNARGVASTRLAAPAAANSAFASAAKWLGIGLVVGLVATSAAYALSDALARSPAATR
ncbi:MAG: sigma-70 family RNA polymerase sigma factor [Polyangiaceae bacterium]